MRARLNLVPSAFFLIVPLDMALPVAVAQVYYVGDQSTLKDNSGTASYHDALNWLNYRSPGGVIPGTDPVEYDDADGGIAGNGRAVFDPATDHRPNNNGGTPPDPSTYGWPRYLYFGDFLDRRTFSQDKVILGGIAKPSFVEVVSGSYTFNLGSNNFGNVGGLEIIPPQSSSALVVGSNARSATLNITGGGTAHLKSMRVGNSAAGDRSTGTIVVSGIGTIFDVEGYSLVGNSVTNGYVTITEGATFITRPDFGGDSGPNGTYGGVWFGEFGSAGDVFGNGSLTIERGAAYLDSVGISFDRKSSLRVQTGGTLTTSKLVSVEGDALVQGAQSSITAARLNMNSKNGTLRAIDGAVVEVGNGASDFTTTINGTFVVDHASFSSATANGTVSVAGTLDVKGASTVALADRLLHVRNGGTVSVSNSSLDIPNSVLMVWLGKVVLKDGAIATTRSTSVGDGGEVSLSGGSIMTTGPDATIGYLGGEGKITIASGAKLISNSAGSPTRTSANIGQRTTDKGTVIVDGAGSLWDSAGGYITVGSAATGILQILSEGTVKSAGGRIGKSAGANGLAVIEGSGSAWEISESLFVGGDVGAAGGAGKLAVKDHGRARINTELRVWQTGAVEIDGTGIVKVGDAGSNPAAGALTVGFGGTLSGNGEIIGDVIIAGGKLTPGASPGRLTVDGDLLMDELSILKLELAGTTADLFDQLRVTGDLSILGTIEISLLGGFSPQVGDKFKFFDVGGALDLSQASFEFPAGLLLISVGAGEFQVHAVPEPASSTLLLLGFALLCHRIRHFPPI